MTHGRLHLLEIVKPTQNNSKNRKYINQTSFSGQKRFKIGQDGSIDTTMVDIRRQIKADMAANSISLKTDLKIGTDYYTSEEVKGFKKRKRKVKKTRVKGGMVLVDDTLARRDFENPIGEKGTVTSTVYGNLVITKIKNRKKIMDHDLGNAMESIVANQKLKLI